MNPVSPGLLVAVSPRRGASGPAQAGRWFQRVRSEPAWTVETVDWWVALWGLDCASVGSDASGDVVAVVHGDVWDAPADPGSALARRYAERGEAFAADVRGSWTALVVDRERDRVLAFTDRTNSRRLYHRSDGELQWLATQLDAMPTRGLQPDPVGVAWYLSNGVVHCGRTPLLDVEVLGGAAVHTVTPSGLEGRRYWRFPYVGPDRELSQEDAGASLMECIRTAVDRCTGGDGATWVSLSGGYDSTAIAGVLRDLGTKGVVGMSYSHGRPTPGSDARVALDMIPHLGFPHRLVESYRGDFMEHLRRNAHLGEGMANACDELDAWETLAGELGQDRPPLLVGDHFLPVNPDRAQAHPAPPPGKLRGPEVLAWLVPHLFPVMARALQEGVPEDVRGITADVDPAILRSVLFFEHRLPNVLLAWRHAFAGRHFRVRNPLLDNDVLDLVGTFPDGLKGSAYYHQTVVQTFPKLFAVPRATRAGYYMDLAGELLAHRAEITGELRDTASPLDDLVSPESALWALEQVRDVRSRPRRAVRKLGHALGGFASGSFDPERSKQLSEARLLRRYVILRQALRRFAA